MSKNLNKNNQKKKLNAYAKYSSITIQMGVIIVGGTFLGLEIDSYLELKFPVFTLVLSLSSVAFAIYLAIKDIIKYND